MIPRARWLLAACLTCLVVVFALLAIGSGMLAPLAVTVLVSMVLVYRRRLGWRLGTILALLVALLGQLLFAWVAPHLGGSFGTDLVLAWTATGIVHALLTVVPSHSDDRSAWNGRRATDLVIALLVPVAMTCYFWFAARRPGPPWIGWGMGGDFANNIIINREFLLQGGLLRDQGNAAPLATVLTSSWGAVGVEDLEYVELVRHLITTGAHFSLVGWMLLSFLASVLTLASAPVTGRGGRVMTAIVAGSVPWLWFVSGHAMTFGFANAFPAMLTLVLGWGCWLEHHRHPVASLTGQVLATWVAATAWGPAAIIPAAWMLTTVVVERRSLRAARWQLLWPVLSLGAAMTYAYVVVLGDFQANSGTLAAEGASPALSYWWCLGVGLALLIVPAVLHRRVSPTVRIGAWAAAIAAGLGVWDLVRAREGLPEWWGYYPVKFTWIVVAALCIVAPSLLQRPAGRLAGRLWNGNGALLTLAALAILMAQVSAPVRPVTLSTLVGPVSWHDGRTWDASLDSMFTLMERDPKSIAARYFTGPVGPQADQLVNFWMMQMGARDTRDPVRVSAYEMNAGDPTSVCAGIANWQGDVTVWTRDPSLAEQLEAVCDPRFDYRVEVVAEASSG